MHTVVTFNLEDSVERTDMEANIIQLYILEKNLTQLFSQSKEGSFMTSQQLSLFYFKIYTAVTHYYPHPADITAPGFVTKISLLAVNSVRSGISVTLP